MKNIKFNIHDLNFILTFAGFAIFTSITDTISSVVYRAFALLVAFLCFAIQRFKLPKLPKALKVLLLITILLDLKTSYHLLIDDTPFVESINLAILFIYGVTLIPVLAFISGYQKINWRSMLVVLELLLFYTIFKGYVVSLEETEDIRMSLNLRQSTLAFGDNSGYLLLLSFCLFKYSSAMIVGNFKRCIWRIFLIVAIVISVLGLARAGSRGPMVAAVMGLVFLFLTLHLLRQFNTLILTIIIIAMFNITTQTLERFAPVLFSRMMLTIEEGDISGREILYEHAIQLVKEKPVVGGNPIILLNDGFTSYHNGYLDVGVGLGWLGFAFYVLLSVWIAIRLITRRHNISNTPQLFCAAMFFLSATRAMTGATLLSNPNYALSIACACILAAKPIIK